jgi:hypothetical protein
MSAVCASNRHLVSATGRPNHRLFAKHSWEVFVHPRAICTNRS